MAKKERIKIMKWLMRFFRNKKTMDQCPMIKNGKIQGKKFHISIRGFCSTYHNKDGNLHQGCMNCKASCCQYENRRYRY